MMAPQKRHDQQNAWLPDLQKLGYKTPVPTPLHVGIQAILSTIEAPEIHAFIQLHDKGIIEQYYDAGRLLLHTLGMQEFSLIADIACRYPPDEATGKAIALLTKYAVTLHEILDRDSKEYSSAEDIAWKISTAIHRPFGAQLPPSPTEEIGIVAQLRKNPNFRMKFYKEERQQDVKQHIEDVNASHKEITRRHYVPVFPSRNYEFDLSRRDGRVWEVRNLSQLAPFSLEMWIQFASLSDKEIAECRTRALMGDSPSKRILENSWPMKLFSAGNYQCAEPAHLHIRLHLTTGTPRDKSYYSKMWNWRRPFFKCDCYDKDKKVCDSKMLWFDHGVWYILTHLELFFKDESLPGKMMSFILFLSTTGKNCVLDHITFMFIREMIIEAALNLYEAPQDPILPEYRKTKMVDMIEKLLKPPEFSDKLEERSHGNKRKWDLNDVPPKNIDQPPNFSFRSQITPSCRGRGIGQFGTYHDHYERKAHYSQSAEDGPVLTYGRERSSVHSRLGQPVDKTARDTTADRLAHRLTRK